MHLHLYIYTYTCLGAYALCRHEESLPLLVIGLDARGGLGVRVRARDPGAVSHMDMCMCMHM